MITKKQYKDAEKLIKEYEGQEKEKQRSKQLKREQSCQEHYYLARGKQTIGMMCQWCGKITN